MALAGERAFVGAYYSDAAQALGYPEAEGAGAVFVFGPQPVGTETEAPEAAEPGAEGLALSVTPNPAQGAAEARLVLAAPEVVTVRVLDARGRSVAVLHAGRLAAGPHRWAVPEGLPAGVYFVVAEGGGDRVVRPLTVLR